MAEGPNERRGK
jgi:hypothetical protein